MSYLPKRIADARQPIAVVSYMSYSGLGIVRSLGRCGIPVVALDPDSRQLGMCSRYAHALACPDQKTAEGDYLGFLLELGTQLRERAVYFPTGDNTLLFFSRHRDALEPYYRCMMPSADLVGALVSKDGLARLCKDHNVPAPLTLCASSRTDVTARMDSLEFPVVIKPTHSHDWRDPAMAAIVGPGTKAIRVDSAEELLETYERVSKVKSSVVIQEVIPGPDEALHYFCGYMDEASRPLAVFLGQKLRVTPIHFGSASFVKSVHDQGLIEESVRFLKAIGYVGLCGIEYKRDARDGVFKVIEFNARFGLWDILATRCGVDIPYVAYRHAVGEEADPCLEFREGVKWVSIARDIAAFRQYHKEGELTLTAWLASLKGEKQWAVFDWDDLLPFVESTFRVFKTKAANAVRRLCRVARPCAGNDAPPPLSKTPRSAQHSPR